MPTIKMSGSFAILDDAGATELNKALNELMKISEYTTHRISVPANSCNFEINLGGLGDMASPVKKLFLRPSIPVNVKLGSIGAPDLLMEGISIISGNVPSVHVTTTAAGVDIELIVAG